MTTQVIHRGLTNPVSFSAVRALILLLALLALVGLLYLGQSSQATMTGQRVQNLQERLERLERENAQLEYDIAALTTPGKMAERARALGLRPATPNQMTFLTVKNYPAAVVKVRRPAISPPVSDAGLALVWQQLVARLGLAPSARTVQATTAP